MELIVKSAQREKYFCRQNIFCHVPIFKKNCHTFHSKWEPETRPCELVVHLWRGPGHQSEEVKWNQEGWKATTGRCTSWICGCGQQGFYFLEISRKHTDCLLELFAAKAWSLEYVTVNSPHPVVGSLGAWTPAPICSCPSLLIKQIPVTSGKVVKTECREMPALKAGSYQCKANLRLYRNHLHSCGGNWGWV